MESKQRLSPGNSYLYSLSCQWNVHCFFTQVVEDVEAVAKSHCMLGYHPNDLHRTTPMNILSQIDHQLHASRMLDPDPVANHMTCVIHGCNVSKLEQVISDSISTSIDISL